MPRKAKNVTPVKPQTTSRSRRTQEQKVPTQSARDNKRRRAESQSSSSESQSPERTPVKGRQRKQLKNNQGNSKIIIEIEDSAKKATPNQKNVTKRGPGRWPSQNKNLQEQKRERSASPNVKRAQKLKKKTNEEKLELNLGELQTAILNGVLELKKQANHKNLLEWLDNEYKNLSENQIEQEIWELERRGALIVGLGGFYIVHQDEIPKPPVKEQDIAGQKPEEESKQMILEERTQIQEGVSVQPEVGNTVIQTEEKDENQKQSVAKSAKTARSTRQSEQKSAKKSPEKEPIEQQEQQELEEPDNQESQKDQASSKGDGIQSFMD